MAVVRVLVLSTTTGYQLRSFDESARRLGLELVLATDRCTHLDDPWRDGAVAVRFYDDEGSLQAIVAAARERPMHGVIAVGDRPTVLAARVTEALGLPGNPVAAAEASRNKKVMRRAFAAAGLRAPWAMDLHRDEDPQVVAQRISYPCVVKPLGLSGSRGVIKAEAPEQFVHAVQRVRALLARPDVRAQRSGLDDRMIVEAYIEGREYAVEGVLTDGALRVLAIFDKPDPLDGPFFEETIYVTPPDIPLEGQQAIADEVQRASTALGLRHGPVHGECRAGAGGVTMLEVAARPIGGLCSRVLRFRADAEEVPLEDVLLRHAVGEDISRYVRAPGASGVMMIPIPGRGMYRGVSGEARAREVPHVDHLEITAKRDQLLEPLPEGDSYLGFIFARAAEPDAVVASLRDAHRRLAFDLEPEVRVIR